MSKTISWNRSDTAVTPSVGSFTPNSLNYAADFAKRSGTGGDITIVNTTGPADRSETIRYAVSKISNVYSGTSVDPSAFALSKRGASVLVQVNDIITVTDSTTNYRYDLPISAHLVVKTSLDEVITSEVLTAIVARLVGATYEQSGTSVGERLSKLIRGAVTPSSLA